MVYDMKSVKEGNSTGQNNIGKSYQKGSGTIFQLRSEAKVFQWYFIVVTPLDSIILVNVIKMGER